MSLRSRFETWWRALAKRDRVAREVEAELLFHMESYAADLQQHQGISQAEAMRRAKAELGGMQFQQEQCRRSAGVGAMDDLFANVRHAARMLRKSPAFTAVAVISLALGIGANTAVFSAIDAILVQPLSFPQGDELVALQQYNLQSKDSESSVATLRLVDWNRLNSTFQAISGYYTQDVSETTGALPERIDEALIAPHFFRVWGVTPALGREFSSEEERFGGPDAVIISDRFWHRRFHAAVDVIGKRLRLGKYAYSIVGVMPSSFLFPDHDVDLWAPSPVDAPYAQDRESTWFSAVGRLKPDVTLAQAHADLATVQQQLGRQYPRTDGHLAVKVESLKSTVVGSAGGSLWLLYGSVTLLLLIACTNIAALLLARTSDREHEISIRFSLGASRRSIVWQLLTETLALALVGSALGMLIAGVLIRGFHQLAKTLPRVEEITFDWKILLYTLVCTFAATLLCGLFPALRGARRELARSLASGGHTQVSSRNSLQWTLVGAQVTFAVTLLIAAGLLLRSFEELGRVAPGFDPSHVLALQISGSWGETTDMKALTQRMDRTLEALRNVPGVGAAATAAALPGVPGQHQFEFAVSEGPKNPNRKIMADTRFVSSGYFEVMRIPLLRGEACHEGITNPKIIVNRSFTDSYFNTAIVMGRHLQPAADNSLGQPGEVQGVVGDAREDGLNSPPVPTVYWCVSAPNPIPYFLIRTRGNPVAMIQALRHKIFQIEPSRSVFDIAPLQQHLNDALLENELRTTLLAMFAGTAVSLACIGLYGTLSYLGRMRRREMGLRLAIGASRLQIAWRFLWQGLRVVGIGCFAGVVLGFMSRRLIAGMLYGVSAADPVTYGGIVLLVALVTLLASLAPALRVARINPVQVLREQ